MSIFFGAMARSVFLPCENRDHFFQEGKKSINFYLIFGVNTSNGLGFNRELSLESAQNRHNRGKPFANVSKKRRTPNKSSKTQRNALAQVVIKKESRMTDPKESQMRSKTF